MTIAATDERQPRTAAGKPRPHLRKRRRANLTATAILVIAKRDSRSRFAAMKPTRIAGVMVFEKPEIAQPRDGVPLARLNEAR